MRAVRNDTRGAGFCGPIAIAALTGKKLSVVLDACREARYPRYGWGDRKPNIRGMTDWEVTRALYHLGRKPQVGWVPVKGRPTLAAFLRARSPELRKAPMIVCVTGHYVAIEGGRFCDTFTSGQPVPISKAPGRRKRVQKYLVL